MDLQLQSKRVLVTAGATGIGREIARTFVAEGANVFICDVDSTTLNQLSHSDPAIHTFIADVADRASVQEMVSAAVKTLGGVDVLVNNAGIAGPTNRIEDMEPEAWDRTIAVNLTGMFNVTRLVVPHIKKAGAGAIVNLSSAAGRFGFAMRSPYAASKWGVIGITKTLAIELGAFNIRVNAILPGAVDGQRQQNVISAKARELNTSPEVVLQRILSATSIKRLIPPQEIASMVAYLASHHAVSISGHAIQIDGDAQMLV
jgi:NAD(P)-dependent dehydrogenase (short-subunit alcohol dehydrogenase family)